MAKQKFGARKHTKKKLDVLDDYLGFFPVALKTKGYRLIYIDAFAGTGEVLLVESDEPLLPGIAPEQEKIDGSAVRALRATIPFDEYVFIEKSQSKLDKLAQELERQFPDRIDRCKFICDDANAAIKDICKTTNWTNYRAVVFLDPFGNQISWDTLEAIAQTRAADLWYLFPAGLGVYRQIPKKGKTQSKAAQSVTRMLGSNEWMFLFTEQTSTENLFGETEVNTQRAVSVEAITTHAISRLRTIFRGGVLDQYVSLGGKAVPWYSLLFACSNPNDAAKTLAHRVAGWIVDHA
ncbi:MAG: three-Cys-motif partner protein TcmP [Hyphomonadaceae bacterium]|nr:three-Cys-motif partner protein TcmP [Hyphomonadaceae bacterium]